ncbi:Ras- protein Rab-24 [Trebouxia sp. C0010 RCD-2024]
MARVDVKVVLLGQQSVGKSCLLDRYITGIFEGQAKNTIGAAFAAKKVKLQNERVISLGIWDTAGAERFQSISRMYYHGSRAAVICFYPGSQQSFAKAKFWAQEVTHNEPNCKVYFAMTMCDLLDQPPGIGIDGSSLDPSPQDSDQSGLATTPDSRDSLVSDEVPPTFNQEVSDDDISAYAKSQHAEVFATSAKTGAGVRRLFATIAEDLATTTRQEPHVQHTHTHTHRRTVRPALPTFMNHRPGANSASSPLSSSHNPTYSRTHRKHFQNCCFLC